MAVENRGHLTNMLRSGSRAGADVADCSPLHRPTPLSGHGGGPLAGRAYPETVDGRLPRKRFLNESHSLSASIQNLK